MHVWGDLGLCGDFQKGVLASSITTVADEEHTVHSTQKILELYTTQRGVVHRFTWIAKRQHSSCLMCDTMVSAISSYKRQQVCRKGRSLPSRELGECEQRAAACSSAHLSDGVFTVLKQLIDFASEGGHKSDENFRHCDTIAGVSAREWCSFDNKGRLQEVHQPSRLVRGEQER